MTGNLSGYPPKFGALVLQLGATGKQEILFFFGNPKNIEI